MTINPVLFQILLVGCGGFIGSIMRFVLSGAAQRIFPSSSFPYGTLTVNTLGCLAIGFLGGLATMKQALGPSSRLFLLIGVLGGFTTFSSFAYETLLLTQDTQNLRALINILLQVVLGLSAAWLGHAAAHYL